MWYDMMYVLLSARLGAQNFRLAQDARLAQEYRDQLDAQQERLLAVDKLEAELSRARKYCQDLDLCRIKYEARSYEATALLYTILYCCTSASTSWAATHVQTMQIYFRKICKHYTLRGVQTARTV